jgi:hypothetical protein
MISVWLVIKREDWDRRTMQIGRSAKSAGDTIAIIDSRFIFPRELSASSFGSFAADAPRQKTRQPSSATRDEEMQVRGLESFTPAVNLCSGCSRGI